MFVIVLTCEFNVEMVKELVTADKKYIVIKFRIVPTALAVLFYLENPSIFIGRLYDKYLNLF